MYLYALITNVFVCHTLQMYLYAILYKCIYISYHTNVFVYPTLQNNVFVCLITKGFVCLPYKCICVPTLQMDLYILSQHINVFVCLPYKWIFMSYLSNVFVHPTLQNYLYVLPYKCINFVP